MAKPDVPKPWRQYIKRLPAGCPAAVASDSMVAACVAVTEPVKLYSVPAAATGLIGVTLDGVQPPAAGKMMPLAGTVTPTLEQNKLCVDTDSPTEPVTEKL